ncbi:MAG TPA: hypothetical protein VFO40_29355 [Chthoniobacterales bacterium]|nr:hypothetical protein [Chthoniobacterales bacterium]
MKIQKSIIMPAADHTPLDGAIAFGGKAFNRAAVSCKLVEAS